ncbi:MAG: DoxX family protein [Gemmatimonadales bacterium]
MPVRDPVRTERWALAVLRVSLGGFLLLWGIEKFVIPDTTVAIWSGFYGIGLAAALVPVVGALESALGIAIAVGLWRRVSYGLGLLLHAISVLSTWRQILDPWGLRSGGSPNHLFLAGVPVLAAFITLYLMRDRDAWTVDERLRQRAAVRAKLSGVR